MAPWLAIRRRVLPLALPLAVGGCLLLAGAAHADLLTPESGGSPNAADIDTLYKLALYIAIPVFLAVEGALLYFLFRYRHRRGRVAAQIRGNTRLEIGWTVGAALILVVLTAVTFTKFSEIKDPPASGANGLRAGGTLYASVDQPEPPGGHRLRIAVSGQQYVWRYTYPNGAFSYDTMLVPINTTVTLDIVAQDVIHSWWIPELGGKMDATPGYVNQTWFRIDKPGTFEGQCAELCGRNHANMLARVRAVPVAEYQRWVADKKRQIEAANDAAAAQRTQQSPTPDNSDQ